MTGYVQNFIKFLVIAVFLFGQTHALAEPCTAMSEAMHKAEMKLNHSIPHDLHGIDNKHDLPCHGPDSETEKNETSNKDCCGTVLCKCSSACSQNILLFQESSLLLIPDKSYQYEPIDIIAFLLTERLERPPRLS